MFAKRLASSVVLVLVALVTILSGGYLLAGTLLVISMIGLREFNKATGVSGAGKGNSLEGIGYAAVAGYYILITFFSDITHTLLAVLLAMMAFMLVYVFSFPKYTAEQMMKAFFGLVYVPVMLSFIYLTRSLPNGIYIVWMIFISSWICDTFAYCAGMLLGRHKLAPKLSPKKSVEGAVGGVLGSALVGALYALLMGKYIHTERSAIWMFALLGAIGAVISQIGDLAASGIKRNNDIKDYGHLIPGHGGILDRFDSVIVTAPMIYFLAVLFVR